MLKNTYLINYLKKATIYEVNLRQYSKEGDIRSFTKHLPRLKKMGIDILWLMPIHPIGEKNKKGTLGSCYSIQNYMDVNTAFGTKEDFKNLVKGVHQLGMKIIIDWVANHAAWDNVWTISHPDYFIRNTAGDFISPNDWTDVIQIDHRNVWVHEALTDAMCYWVKEFDIDGFRADLAHLTPLHFWVNAKAKIASLKPDLIWLAETEEIEYYQAFDIIYSWKWMHKSEEFFKKNLEISELIQLLQDNYKKHELNPLQLYFTTNHDENSWNGTEFEKFGIYADAISVFNFMYPYAVPLIYSGQEIPNRKRLLFFDKDEINWDVHLEKEMFYSKLIQCRKNRKENSTINFFDQDNHLFGFKSGVSIGAIIVVLNFGKNNIHFNPKNAEDYGLYKNIFNLTLISINADFNIELKPGGYILLERVA